jgi:hypothetical protein
VVVVGSKGTHVTRVTLGNGTLAEMSWRGVRTASCFVGGNGTHVSRAAPYNTNIINTLQQSILSRGRSAFAVYPLSYFVYNNIWRRSIRERASTDLLSYHSHKLRVVRAFVHDLLQEKYKPSLRPYLARGMN